MTQERTNKLVLLSIFAMYLCALRIAREACDLSTPACHLRLGCSAACVPAFYVATARITLFLLPCHRGHYFYCWYGIIFFQKFFNTQSTKEVRMQKWRKLRSGSSDWDGGRAWRRQKATRSNDQDGGDSSFLSNNSERETYIAETGSSMSAEPPPSEDTWTTRSVSESVIIADSDTELFRNW